MTAGNSSIVEAYETLGMSPEEIADTQGFDLLAVKTVLSQFSTLYRESLRVEAKDEISKDPCPEIASNEVEEAYRCLVDTMRYEEDDKHLKFKAATRIIDEKRGRLDKARELQSARVNIVVFNQQLLASRKAKERVLGKYLNSNINLNNRIDTVPTTREEPITLDLHMEKVA